MADYLNNVPKRLEGLLTTDEYVVEHYRLKNGLNAYATTRRLFIADNNTIRDIAYQHIAGICLVSEKDARAITIGTLLVLLGIGSATIFGGMDGAVTGLIILVFGFLFLYVGLKPREGYLQVDVLGMAQPYYLYGRDNDLRSLLRYMREKHV